MFVNFEDNNNENDKNNSIIESSNNVKSESSSLKFDIIAKNPLIINKIFKELLQELHDIILLNIEDYTTDQLNEFIYNFLLEYDLDPKNVFEIMTNNLQHIFYYSSLIGIFYQYGIGCEVDEIKASKIFFNTVKNNQKVIVPDQFTFDISFFDIKELNEIITQYFYSLFLYNDIILNKRNNYKFHIKYAEKGDSISQYHIGNCYFYNINARRDYNKAIEWYLKSSEGGNIKAMYRLAYCYACGYGVKKDEKKAFELYLKSAEGAGGYKHALWVMGNYYYYGLGILKDENKAFEFYLKAAKKGHNISQYLIANYYYDGKYIPENKAKWFYWNRKAAINGNADAQFKLAEYYTANSSNKNEDKAFKWYMQLANKKKLKAIYIIAKCFRDGIGTDKNLKEATSLQRGLKNMNYQSLMGNHKSP
ncbi:unnamed protein product [Rhizophagus irregularis]|nr:unnamed protein product [Rhizophagus irregularis]